MSGDLAETIPNKAELEGEYELRKSAYQSVLEDFERLVRDRLETAGLHPTIKGRVKSFESLYKKRIRLLRQARMLGAEKPIPITDIVGIRVVCPFLGDLERAVKVLSACFTVTEIERKGAERSFREFGYESIHLLVELPAELGAARPGLDIRTCEIQLRTILQEAWAEVEHELVYKSEFTPFDEPMKRKLAALNANLSLSDIIFQEIRDYQHRLTEELTQRRNDFHAKIESSIDGPFEREKRRAAGELLAKDSLSDGFSPVAESLGPEQSISRPRPVSLDDMLLEALFVHNRGRYGDAIDIYTRILEAKPPKEVAAVIHKHRGMAWFSETRYPESIEDFSAALALDPKCYKAAYFRGVVHNVLENYGAALEDYDLSLSINPFQYFAIYRRAQAYWHLEDYAKTIADCEAALAIEPEREEAAELKRLALAKLKM